MILVSAPPARAKIKRCSAGTARCAAYSTSGIADDEIRMYNQSITLLGGNMTTQFGPETLSAIFGVLLSLFMSYVPRVKTWFDKQPPINKRAIMAVGLFLVAGGAYGLS